MKKRIGDIEINTYGYQYDKDQWHKITVHYNQTMNDSITIKCFDALCDLEYAISQIKRKVLGDYKK